LIPAGQTAFSNGKILRGGAVQFMVLQLAVMGLGCVWKSVPANRRFNKVAWAPARGTEEKNNVTASTANATRLSLASLLSFLARWKVDFINIFLLLIPGDGTAVARGNSVRRCRTQREEPAQPTRNNRSQTPIRCRAICVKSAFGAMAATFPAGELVIPAYLMTNE